LVFSLIAKNNSQAYGFQTTAARVTNANTGLYTVPAGKVARIISITMNVDALGADASYAAAIKRGATFTPVAPFAVVNGNSNLVGEISLNAGDIVTDVGDAGSTNGTVDMTVTFQEFDV